MVASTGADLGACVVAGFAALSGPRHGAAVERILDMFDAIGEPERAEDWMKAEDRSPSTAPGIRALGVSLAGPAPCGPPESTAWLWRRHATTSRPAAEDAGTRLLAGRRLVPNVDLFAALVLEACGIPRRCFGATFAAARIVGWCAHAIEQASETKILRPSAHYVGPIPDLPIEP